MKVQQPTLFGPPPLPPASRRTDPATSHAAEREVSRSGRRLTQLQAVLADVRSHPGATAGEIARRTGIDRSTVSKRTADLANQGRIDRGQPRECAVHRRQMTTWWVNPFFSGGNDHE